MFDKIFVLSFIADHYDIFAFYFQCIPQLKFSVRQIYLVITAIDLRI